MTTPTRGTSRASVLCSCLAAGLHLHFHLCAATTPAFNPHCHISPPQRPHHGGPHSSAHRPEEAAGLHSEECPRDQNASRREAGTIPITNPLQLFLRISMISHLSLRSSATASQTQPTFSNLRLDPNMSFVRNRQGSSSAKPPTVSTASIASSPRSPLPMSLSHAHTFSAKMTRSSARHSTLCPTSMAASSQTPQYPT